MTSARYWTITSSGILLLSMIGKKWNHFMKLKTQYNHIAARLWTLEYILLLLFFNSLRFHSISVRCVFVCVTPFFSWSIGAIPLQECGVLPIISKMADFSVTLRLLHFSILKCLSRLTMHYWKESKKRYLWVKLLEKELT